MESEYYTPAEAAQILSVEYRTIIKLIKKKKIKVVSIGTGDDPRKRSIYRIPKEEIKNLINYYGSEFNTKD